MTVVAGYVDREGGRVHLAADSAASAGDGIIVPKAKIHTLEVDNVTGSRKEQVIVGSAGWSFVAAVLVAHQVIGPTPFGNDSAAHDWAQQTAERITKVAIEHGAIDDDRKQLFDGAILLGWRGRLWSVNHDLALPVEDYLAVGSGGACAMGAMFARPKDTPAADVPKLAVAAAVEHIYGIGGPITYACTESADG